MSSKWPAEGAENKKRSVSLVSCYVRLTSVARDMLVSRRVYGYFYISIKQGGTAIQSSLTDFKWNLSGIFLLKVSLPCACSRHMCADGHGYER